MSKVVFQGFNETFVNGQKVESIPIDVDVTDAAVEYALHDRLRSFLNRSKVERTKMESRLEVLDSLEIDKDVQSILKEVLEGRIAESKIVCNLLRLVIKDDLLLDIE